MNIDNVMTLVASRRADLSRNSKVFNLSSLEYHLWIYLNPKDIMGCTFLGAEEINNEEDFETFSAAFERDSQCWIKVTTGLINKSPRLHIYKLNFVDTRTETDFSLYVSYYIQTDNPDKPYVYIEPGII